MAKKLLIALILLISLPSANLYAWDDCPYGQVDDPYPGDCARYVDTDNDGICDHSQPAPEDRVGSVNTIDAEQQGRTYHLLPITLILIALYGISRLLTKKKILSVMNHRKIWNVLLLFAFLISGILGILLVIEINFNVAIPLPFNMLFWHVEVGIAMFTIIVFHVAERWAYFKSVFKI